MSTPEGIKDTWKNIDWKNKDEKRAFFNKYFLNGEFVKECGYKKNDFKEIYHTEADSSVNLDYCELLIQNWDRS